MIHMAWHRLESLLHEHSTVWLALSGGIDSVVLLDLLMQHSPSTLRQRVKALHVHHGLSPHADQWLEHCQSLCAHYGVELTCEHVQVSTTGSLEEQARQQRYQVFERHMKAGDVLLQGHHANDQAETLLFRLERGCGWRGIQGIPEMRVLGPAHILRPLLQTSREEIECYAQAQDLVWVEDESNQDPQYRRNFLRHQVLAPWQRSTPRVAKQIAHNVSRLQADSRVLERLLREALNEFVACDGGLLLASVPTAERGFWLEQYLHQNGVNVTQPQCLALETMFFSDREKRPEYQSGAVRLARFENVLYVLPPSEPVIAQSLQGGTWLERTFDRLYCDQDVTIKGRPEGLSLRLSNGRHRPLKKWLQDQKIPSWWREQLPYVFAGEKLIAVGDLWVHPDWSGLLIWHRNGRLVWPDNAPKTP